MKYKKKLFDYLSGKAFGVPRGRLGWTGYMAVHELFVQSSQGERQAIIEAMLEIVRGPLDSTDEEKWLVAADLIHLANSLDLRNEQLEHLVRELRAKRAPEQCAEAISYASSTYLHLS